MLARANFCPVESISEQGSWPLCIVMQIPYIRADIPILILFRALGFVVGVTHTHAGGLSSLLAVRTL